jgi:hypothetical protein
MISKIKKIGKKNITGSHINIEIDVKMIKENVFQILF